MMLLINEHIVSILKVGLSGLAFLLMVLTYYLLLREQRREKPDEKMLKAIKQFSLLALVFVIIVGGFGFAELFLKTSQTTSNSPECMESIERLKTLSQSQEQTKEDLKALIESQLNNCK